MLTPPTLNSQYSLLSPSPKFPTIGVPVTGSPAPHRFLVLTNAKEQDTECPQHGGPFPQPVQGRGASGAQCALQVWKDFAPQQVVKSKCRGVFTQQTCPAPQSLVWITKVLDNPTFHSFRGMKSTTRLPCPFSPPISPCTQGLCWHLRCQIC